MGMSFIDVTFDGEAPPLSKITGQITAITGLPVIVRESCDDSLFHFHARLAFEAVPDHSIEITAYRPAAVRRQMEEMGMSDQPVAQFVQGANEPKGTQTVYLQGFVESEPTLMMSTAIALEALGGRVKDHRMTDELRSKFGQPISAAELERRHGQAQNRVLLSCLIWIVLLPLMIPCWLIAIAWSCLTMPFRIWRAYQVVRRIEREREARRGGAPAP